MRVVGVDGCRGGWLAAELTAENTVTWRWTDDVTDLLGDDADAVAIDIPIGLPEAGVRVCDRQARAMLGSRGTSVFPAPVRPVLGCSTYAEARGELARHGGPSMSAQAFGIVAAVRQVDRAVSPSDEPRVVEAHPEVAFAVMGAGPGLAGKRSTAGLARRVRLLQTWLPGVLDALAEAPAVGAPDDALDALACAWVARRWASGSAQVIGDGARDARGLLMRIVV